MKTCSKCGVPKSESEFSPAGFRRPGKLQSRCKSCASEANRQRRLENPGLTRAYDQKRYWDDPEFARERARKNYAENPEPAKKAVKKWRGRNKTQVRLTRNQWHRDQVQNNLAYKIEKNLRSRVSKAVKNMGAKKSAPTLGLVGCAPSFLVAHLEANFQSGMTWENHGPVWHIDHIKPCAKFDLTDPEQQKVCFHWTNLQPLFAIENLQKGDKYEQC